MMQHSRWYNRGCSHNEGILGNERINSSRNSKIQGLVHKMQCFDQLLDRLHPLKPPSKHQIVEKLFTTCQIIQLKIR